MSSGRIGSTSAVIRLPLTRRFLNLAALPTSSIKLSRRSSLRTTKMKQLMLGASTTV
uniref:Uncharacterized protein n=1 Tax=Rhizophora mucronata TaxID=61149 RepID=A0A2P2M724_RHIMU